MQNCHYSAIVIRKKYAWVVCEYPALVVKFGCNPSCSAVEAWRGLTREDGEEVRRARRLRQVLDWYSHTRTTLRQFEFGQYSMQCWFWRLYHEPYTLDDVNFQRHIRKLLTFSSRLAECLASVWKKSREKFIRHSNTYIIVLEWLHLLNLKFLTH